MRYLKIVTAVILVASCGFAAAAENRKTESMDYIREPMPPGFQVVNTEIEGPVFADAAGHTLYTWPRLGLRGGSAGEDEGKPGCYDEHYRENVGYFSPYPGGNELPNADNRPTCIQYWPPVLAAADAKPTGHWSILERTDNTKQWAYKGYAVYTSHLDRRAGETNGGRSLKFKSDHGVPRNVVKPAANIPSQFEVMTKTLGQLLTTDKGYSVYAYDQDSSVKLNCVGNCLEDWEPLIAPDSAAAQGDWSIVRRPGGQRQWVFRGKPLYRYIQETKPGSFDGSDVPGWKNVFLQRAPRPPKILQVIDTNGGQALADGKGHPIYYYDCVEDTLDSLRCDTPDAAQEYRWAMCGGGDPVRCVQTFPYVLAEVSAKSDSTSWGTRDIDPKSGRYVAANTPGALHIWVFRDRPIYTFAGDRDFGDMLADAWGQDHASKNGFNAFWTRDNFWGLD